jgi:methylmalonyl-CoA/ethylmalonyl-CoA epimerase
MNMPDSMRRLHHCGFAVRSIAATANAFARSLRMFWNGEIIEDTTQDASVAFLKRPGPDCEPLIELVEPLTGRSPVHSHLRRGGGLYHLCYEVESLPDELEASRAAGSLVVRLPLPARAFKGRMVAWVYTPEHLLMEYLQK